MLTNKGLDSLLKRFDFAVFFFWSRWVPNFKNASSTKKTSVKNSQGISFWYCKITTIYTVFPLHFLCCALYLVKVVCI